MFSGSADLYDLLYSGFKDYDAESAAIAETIRAGHANAVRVLDVGCGTGEHARILTERYGYHVDGLDIDSGFVRIAQGKLPGAAVHAADMTQFDLDARYDAIVCLFSSIGYVRTLDGLRSAFGRFRVHLAAAGIVVVEPWFEPGVLVPGRVMVNQAARDGVTVCRMSHLTIEGRLSRIRFEYLIGRQSGIERATETHELGLFTVAETIACFAAAGLNAIHYPQGPSGRGLYVAQAV